MDDNSKKLEGKLVESLEVKELGSLTADYTELGLDSILDDGIFKDIPILRTIVGFVKIGFNVRDRIYVKKVCSFLAQVGQTTQEQRAKFVKDNCQNVRQFEEAVLLILEQSDRFEKTSLIGKIFKACILRKITYEDTLRLSDMVNRVFWADLEAMLALKENSRQHLRLFTSGLFEFDFNTFKFATDDERGLDVIKDISYKRNDYAFALQMIDREEFENLKMTTLGIMVEKK